jgi:hypothetical protein
MKLTNPKSLAGLLSLLLILAVAWPVRLNWTQKKPDSFPLSYYPMFSHDRQGRADVTYLVGVSGSGERQYLPYQLAGTGGMNQVRKTILKRSKKKPDALCQKVARNLTKSPELAGIQTVKVIRSQFEFDRFYTGDKMPSTSTVLCQCDVNRETVAMAKK